MTISLNDTRLECLMAIHNIGDIVRYFQVRPDRVWNIAITAALSMSGLFWNTLISLTIFRRKKLQSSSHILLCYFSFVGVLYSFIIGFGWNTLNILSMYDVISCKGYVIIKASSATCGMMVSFTYICISCDQLLVIYKPYFYSKHINQNRTFYIKIITCGWLVIAITNSFVYAYKMYNIFAIYSATFISICIVWANISYTLLFINIRKINAASFRTEIVAVGDTSKQLHIQQRRKQKNIALVALSNIFFTTFFLLPYIVESALRASGVHISQTSIVANIWLPTVAMVKFTFCPVFCCMRIRCIAREARNVLKCQHQFGHGI